jgi:hypothetical protein
MIAVIKALTTIIGLVVIGLYLAGARIPGAVVVMVVFGLIFTHIELKGPPL